MDWDSKLCYKLIDKYQLNELLWNLKNPLYSKKFKTRYMMFDFEKLK